MKETNQDTGQNALPPVSSVGGVAGDLIQQGRLSAPTKPGCLASLDHYQILSVLGEGGMGIVINAVDSRDGSSVAIKLLRPELTAHPQQVQRFLKEARHMQRVRHPAILPVLLVSENQETPYFAMPLMRRGSLAQQISEDHQMAEDEALGIALQVASALEHAHAKGVIHRDLKPGNVLLDDSGTAFLADFGLARTLFNDSVTDPQVEGTAHYMSPQLARGEIEDTRCDIYAFGALLYEMLAGRPPYEGQSTAQILQKIRTAPPEPIRALRPKLSQGLAEIVEGAMAREHRDRYANMADVVADLNRIKQGTLPVGPHEALSLRWFASGKARKFIGVASGCLVLGIGVLGFNSYRNSWALETQWLFTSPQVFSWAEGRAGDWDGDGETDVVNVVGDQLHVLSSHGQHQEYSLDKLSGAKARLGMLADIDGDNRDDAFVSWSDPTNAHLTVLNQRTWPIRDFTFAGSTNANPKQGTYYTAMYPLQLVDLDRDGHKELLANVSSSWGLQPRGIACFDAETAKLKWFFKIANFIMGAETRDIDGDGRLEVVATGNSPGNFPVGKSLEDGTDDHHAYVYVLTSQGGLKWRRELGGLFASVYPLCRAATNQTVLLWVTAGHAHTVLRGEPDTGRILEFDAQGTLVRSNDLHTQLTSALAVDLDRDGQEEILAADRLGFLHNMSPELELKSSRLISSNLFSEVDLRLFDASAWHQPGAARVILTSSQVERIGAPEVGNTREQFESLFHHNNRVMVLDSNLEILSNFLIAEKWSRYPGIVAQVFQTSANGGNDLVVLSDKATVLRLTKPPLFGRPRGSQQLTNDGPTSE